MRDRGEVGGVANLECGVCGSDKRKELQYVLRTPTELPFTVADISHCL